jgi:hypothetical protein
MATDSSAVSSLTTATPSVTEHLATDVTSRQVARFASLALCTYPLALTEPIEDLSATVPAWWTIFAVIVVVVPAAAMFASTWNSDVGWTRRTAVAVCVGYAVVIASYPLVWNGQTASGDFGFWMAPMAGVASVTAAVVMPIAAATCYLAASVIATRLINNLVNGTTHSDHFVTDLAWGFSVAAVAFVIGILALRAGRVLDATNARAYQRTVAWAAHKSRRNERARLDGITHDRVMSILLAVSRTGVSDEMQHQAAVTIEQLDALRTADDPLPDVTPTVVIREFDSAASTMDETIAVHYGTALTSPTTTYPAGAVRALAAAAAEALHNSVRHAGPHAARQVRVTMSDDELVVDIIDNGAGFVESDVSTDRFGVALSIRGRMESVPGGSADVESAPGEGTRVHLCWTRPT